MLGIQDLKKQTKILFCFENYSSDAGLVGLSVKRLYPLGASLEGKQQEGLNAGKKKKKKLYPLLSKRWSHDPTQVVIHIKCSLFKGLGRIPAS